MSDDKVAFQLTRELFVENKEMAITEWTSGIHSSLDPETISSDTYHSPEMVCLLLSVSPSEGGPWLSAGKVF